jgi:peptidoglycan/LPS O-acetylase OafA/YrhL
MPEASAPSSLRHTRYESLDHWRGLACLLVIVYHSTVMYLTTTPVPPSGMASGAVHWLLSQTGTFSVGVAIFFVISGYCIAAAADRVRRGGQGVGQYFFRRFRRIYPPLWVVIAASVAFFVAVDYWPVPGLLSRPPWMQPRPTWYSPTQWLGNFTLTETWRHHLFGDIRAHFPGQAWTLCYEEQFYLVTGLLLAIRPQAFFRGAWIITLLTLIAYPLARVRGLAIDGFFFDGAWLLFAAGVAVYYRLHHATRAQARVVDVVLVAAIPAAWVANVPINGAVMGFAFAAALPMLYRFDTSVAKSRLLAPLFVSGQMCYSLYLVHQLPVKAVTTMLLRSGLNGPFATLLLAIPLSVATSSAIGWFFHVNVERRFLNTPLPVRAIAAAAALPPSTAGQIASEVA